MRGFQKGITLGGRTPGSFHMKGLQKKGCEKICKIFVSEYGSKLGIMRGFQKGITLGGRISGSFHMKGLQKGLQKNLQNFCI